MKPRSIKSFISQTHLPEKVIPNFAPKALPSPVISKDKNDLYGTYSSRGLEFK
jgi:hypothetical protein